MCMHSETNSKMEWIYNYCKIAQELRNDDVDLT